MRVLLSGGGTGGHVYPVLTVVDALRKRWPEWASRDEPLEFLYVGTAEGVESQLVQQVHLPFSAISAGQIRIANPFKLAINAVRMARGTLQARQILARWRPDALFVTGGYVCGPVVWAAARQKTPILIYLPDITPGIGVQRLAKHATAIAVSFEEVERNFRQHNLRVIPTGYPVRAPLRHRSMSKSQARSVLGLAPELPTLLAFGGSRGARAINQALAGILPTLLEKSQIIHISGKLDHDQAQQRSQNLPPQQRRRYRLFAYLHDEMIAALHAADLVVARAGASTLGEFPALGLPAILIPLPISGGHQLHNARYLADRDAAIIIKNEDMSRHLLPAIQNLLSNPERLAAMSRASLTLARPQAADAIAKILIELTQSPTNSPLAGVL